MSEDTAGLINALPYVDQQYNNKALKDQVDKLIAEEMKSLKPSATYLAHLPMPTLKFEETQLLKEDWKRVQVGAPMQPIDTARYGLDPPPANKQTDLNAWKAALFNAQSQLEHQTNRIVNLELLQKYGCNAWLHHLKTLDTSLKSLQNKQAVLKSEIEVTNRKRKTDQMEVQGTLRKLEGDWVESVRKNMEIEQANMLLERDLKKLRPKEPPKEATE